MQERQHRALKALERRGRLRSLTPRHGLDFSSNDYLALAASDDLRQAAMDALNRGIAMGATGPRLLRGNDPEHEALEAEAASFFGGESCLFFANGFSANQAVLSTLPAHGDHIIADTLIHASVHDGISASKASSLFVNHNDPAAFEDAISAWRQAGGTGRPWLVVESLYSMDGDRAPLDELCGIADRHDAMLIIDEAHATGVFGPEGRGLAAHLEGRENVITVHTCGKALGVMGALVMLPRLYRDFLINRARGFIYSTAPSPLIAAVVRASLKTCANAEDLRGRLQALIKTAQYEIKHYLGIAPTDSQIQPVIIGAAERAVEIAYHMTVAGFDVRAVRPPTVPEGSSRLRVSLTLNVTEDDVRHMIAKLAATLQGTAA